MKVDIELKSLVNRIKGVASQIKQKVKKQKELSESFISEKENEEDDTSLLQIEDVNQINLQLVD